MSKELETPKRDLAASDAIFKDGYQGPTFNGHLIDFVDPWRLSEREVLEEQADAADEVCRTIEDVWAEETL